MNNDKNTKISRIVSLYVELTNCCNYNCAYCYNDSKYENKQYLDADKYKCFLLMMKQCGLSSVALSGGEPMLHPLFLEIIKYNHSLGLKQVVISNGSFLTKDVCNHFKHYDVGLNLTIDGFDEKTNDAIRNVGSYKALQDSLELLQESKLMQKN